MKYCVRIIVFCLCLILISNVSAYASIQTENANKGYFSVYYQSSKDIKMKVGITYKDKTTFYSYTPNKKINYAFINGNGKYSITLYENVYNNFYRAVLPEEEVNVKLKSKLSPYLVSTYDVSFKKGDTVCKTADKICYKLKYKSSKIIAI